MEYGYRKTINLPFDQAVSKTLCALKENGFGVLCDIDARKTVKEKLGKDINRYRIFGACNPPQAYAALQNEPEIGLLLPCNVIVYEGSRGVTVSAVDPMALFSVVDNDALIPVAQEVRELLRAVIDSIT